MIEPSYFESADSLTVSLKHKGLDIGYLDGDKPLILNVPYFNLDTVVLVDDKEYPLGIAFVDGYMCLVYETPSVLIDCTQLYESFMDSEYLSTYYLAFGKK